MKEGFGRMSEGLATTFRVLAATESEAVSRLLIEALDSPHAPIRQKALETILARRNLAGHREIVARLHTFDESWRAIVEKNRGRLTPALRQALVGTDRQACLNACQAAVGFRQYDLIPALLNALEDTGNPRAEALGRALQELVELLGAELSAPQEPGRRHDPELVRNHVLGSLELSMGRFARHRRRLVIEALVQLAPPDNAVLREILENPYHAAFLALVKVLSKGKQPGVIGLLLSLLEDPRAPSVAMSVIGKRTDAKFVEALLAKIARRPSDAVEQNLRRIESVAWARAGGALLDRLDESAQRAAVRLVTASGTPRDQAFALVEHLLVRGKPGGRRAAAHALGGFYGAEANGLALRALKDDDPDVQTAILPQIRRRGIPGALSRLVDMLDSPHAMVRRVARESLSEFSFQHFLKTFDTLDEEVRRSTGELVKRVDPYVVGQLRVEMASRVRRRRLRALAIAELLDLSVEVESSLLGLLRDEEHMVRAEAAGCLGRCRSPASRDALWEALIDRSLTVREAARRSLDERGEAPPQPSASLTGDPGGPP